MLEEYDIFVSKDNNGKIKISTNLYIEYWLNQHSSTRENSMMVKN